MCVVGSFATSPACARSLQGFKAKKLTDLHTYLLTKWFIVLHFATKNRKIKNAIKIKEFFSSPCTTVIKSNKILTIVKLIFHLLNSHHKEKNNMLFSSWLALLTSFYLSMSIFFNLSHTLSLSLSIYISQLFKLPEILLILSLNKIFIWCLKWSQYDPKIIIVILWFNRL